MLSFFLLETRAKAWRWSLLAFEDPCIFLILNLSRHKKCYGGEIFVFRRDLSPSVD
jgi:hypothetical protein